MIIPVGSSVPAQQVDTDHRDLLTALKLLSGEECVRDASQAQVLLLGLTESKHDDVANDARAVMKTGLDRGWFEDTAPKFYELRLFAERSLTTYEKGPQQRQLQLALLIAGGIFTLVLGLFFYMRTSSGDAQPPMIMMSLIAMIVMGLGVFVFMRVRQ